VTLIFAHRLNRLPHRNARLAGQAEAKQAASQEAARPKGWRRFRLNRRQLVFALPFVLACDGDNLFSGNSSATQPRASVFGPSLVVTGDEFQVQVFAEAVRGISRIDVAIVDAFYQDTTLIVTGASQTASPLIKFHAPESFLTPTMIVMARVVDRRGTVSSISADTAAALARQ
jgi:hypothetical protein